MAEKEGWLRSASALCCNEGVGRVVALARKQFAHGSTVGWVELGVTWPNPCGEGEMKPAPVPKMAFKLEAEPSHKRKPELEP